MLRVLLATAFIVLPAFAQTAVQQKGGKYITAKPFATVHTEPQGPYCATSQDGKEVFLPCFDRHSLSVENNLANQATGAWLNFSNDGRVVDLNSKPLFSVASDGQVTVDWNAVVEAASGPIPSSNEAAMQWGVARAMLSIKLGGGHVGQPW